MDTNYHSDCVMDNRLMVSFLSMSMHTILEGLSADIKILSFFIRPLLWQPVNKYKVYGGYFFAFMSNSCQYFSTLELKQDINCNPIMD